MRPVFDPSAVHHLKHRGAVDADGHLLEDAALWQHYIEARYRDRALGIKRDDMANSNRALGQQIIGRCMAAKGYKPVP